MANYMKLSIIIPVYNLGNYITCLLSSLCTLYFPYEYEILIINDGSNDDTAEIVERYQKNNPRIKLITIENGGVSNARNIGLRIALGEYITFVDGDDYVDPDFFYYAINEMDSERYDFVQINHRVIGDGVKREKLFVQNDVVISNRTQMIHSLIGKEKKIGNAVWGKVYRSDVIKDLRFDTELRIAEDKKFVFDVIKCSQKIKLLKYIGYNYIKRPNSAMQGEIRANFCDNLKVLEYIKDYSDSSFLLADIERQELPILMGLYQLNLCDDKDNQEYYSMIQALNVSNFWQDLGWKMKVKTFVLKKARRIYDGVYWVRRRGRISGE